MTIHEFGRENKDTVILLHPSAVMWDYFEYVIPLLENRYHLMVPALPGYDEEKPGDFTSVEEIASVLADQLEERGITDIALIYGCSMGGAIVARFLAKGVFKTVLTVVFILAALAFAVAGIWMNKLHKAFDYNGTRQMARQIIEGVADYAKLPDGGVGLDVGCGSGALTIACAKRFPKAGMIGIDRWGKEYASFNKPLCENNAKAEGVANVSFRQGDAVKLDFPDETFDLVTSNYVYHNIPSKDRQAILLETLRTLKKGGTFAIHDIMSRSKYGDMEGFVKKLEMMGFEDVQLIKTDNGKFMEPGEAGWMGLSGSAILYGRK